MKTILVLEEKTGKLITRMSNVTIETDGCIKVPTTKGDGWMVCKESAIASGVDAAKAIFEKNEADIYWKIDEPRYGKIIKLQAGIVKKNWNLNPEWKRYNDAQNEGGEGYVPSNISKYIETK